MKARNLLAVLATAFLTVPMAFAAGNAAASDAEKNNSTEMNRTARVPNVRRAATGGVRVVFIGNSITLHGPAPKIGWTNNWGMAASAPEKDFAHLVTAGIERETGRKVDLCIRNLADFERHFETYDFSREDDLVAFRPDYLVVALGENVRGLPTEKDRLAYRAAFKKLLSRFTAGPDKPKTVVRSTFWRNDILDAQMAHAANELAVTFVSAPCTDDSQKAIGLFKHSGIAAHPGDRGMAMIAEKVLAGFFPKGGSK